MALHVPKAPGFAQMLKEGARVSVSHRKWVISRHVVCVGVLTPVMLLVIHLSV